MLNILNLIQTGPYHVRSHYKDYMLGSKLEPPNLDFLLDQDNVYSFSRKLTASKFKL